MTGPLVTLIIPFYNEVDYLPATLASLAAQSDRRFTLLLVDNGSTDGSAACAGQLWAKVDDVPARHLHEGTPGKLFALQSGLAAVTTPFVATLDADTLYPPDYVARLLQGFAAPDVVAVLAFNKLRGQTASTRWRDRLWALLLPRKCHAGGCGQAFRTDVLRMVGGFDPARWPLVLEDHEIIHRIARRGRLLYPVGHVCRSSDRRSDYSGCSWNLPERALYKLLPDMAMDWYFYRFLGPRLAARGLQAVALREGGWRQAVQAAS